MTTMEELRKRHSLMNDIRTITQKAKDTYNAMTLRKRIIYGSIGAVFLVVTLLLGILSQKLQRNLNPVAEKMESAPGSVIVLGLVIALVSIPPLFGHELLGVIAGYVYGSILGFLILTVASTVGESVVYYMFRRFLRSRIDQFRWKYHSSYGIFVSVIEDGGVLMLVLIRMSVIPPHFSTPLFAGLESITWKRWMLANIIASPIRMFPPVFIGSLLRNSRSNSILGDVAFILSTFVTFGVLWTIRKQYLIKADELELARIRAIGKIDPETTEEEVVMAPPLAHVPVRYSQAPNWPFEPSNPQKPVVS